MQLHILTHPLPPVTGYRVTFPAPTPAPTPYAVHPPALPAVAAITGGGSASGSGQRLSAQRALDTTASDMGRSSSRMSSGTFSLNDLAHPQPPAPHPVAAAASATADPSILTDLGVHGGTDPLPSPGTIPTPPAAEARPPSATTGGHMARAVPAPEAATASAAAVVAGALLGQQPGSPGAVQPAAVNIPAQPRPPQAAPGRSLTADDLPASLAAGVGLVGLGTVTGTATSGGRGSGAHASQSPGGREGSALKSVKVWDNQVFENADGRR